MSQDLSITLGGSSSVIQPSEVLPDASTTINIGVDHEAQDVFEDAGGGGDLFDASPVTIEVNDVSITVGGDDEASGAAEPLVITLPDGVSITLQPDAGSETTVSIDDDEIEIEAGDITITIPVDEDASLEPPEDPVIEDPVIEDPVIEDPVIEDPVIEDPVVEDPVIEDPVIEDPVIEDPVIDDPPRIDLPIDRLPVIGRPVPDEPPVIGRPVPDEPPVIVLPVEPPVDPVIEDPAPVPPPRGPVIEDPVIILPVEPPVDPVIEDPAPVDPPSEPLPLMHRLAHEQLDRLQENVDSMTLRVTEARAELQPYLDDLPFYEAEKAELEARIDAKMELRDQLPADSPERAAVQAEIDELLQESSELGGLVGLINARLDTITSMGTRLDEATAILDERATLDPADPSIPDLASGVHVLNAFLDIPFVTDVDLIDAQYQDYRAVTG